MLFISERKGINLNPKGFLDESGLDNNRFQQLHSSSSLVEHQRCIVAGC